MKSTINLCNKLRAIAAVLDDDGMTNHANTIREGANAIEELEKETHTLRMRVEKNNVAGAGGER